jgi:hypothetical protein
LKRQPATVILEAVDLLGRQRSKLLEETQGISLTPTLRAAPVEKQNRHPGKGRPGHWLEFPNNRLFYVSAFYCETAGHSITLSRQVANRHRSVRKRLPELGIELLGTAVHIDHQRFALRKAKHPAVVLVSGRVF